MPSVKLIIRDEDQRTTTERIFKNATVYEDSELHQVLIFDIDSTNPNERGEQRARFHTHNVVEWEIIDD